MPKNTEKQLEAISEIYDKHGAEAAMRMGDSAKKVEVIPTGSILLDRALVAGGLPRGQFTEIYGPEASGKSTLCQSVVAQAQKKGLRCAYIDMEQTLDATYAEAIGVDLNELWISQPDYGEQALDIAAAFARTGEFGLVVIDSIAALVPKSEIEGDFGNANVGAHARLIAQAVRKLTPLAKKSNTALLFTNQLREKIGVMYGSPETTPGGRAMKHAASVRLDIRRKEYEKQDGEPSGIIARVRVAKNKIGPPFREANLKIIYGEGISAEDGLLRLGVEYGLIKKSGAWFSYNDENFAQGAEKARVYLKENPEFARMLNDTLESIHLAE